MCRTRKGRISAKRAPSATIIGASSAHPYHCGASATKARQRGMGRLAMRENITVSNVESTTGTVATHQASHGFTRVVRVGHVWDGAVIGEEWQWCARLCKSGHPRLSTAARVGGSGGPPPRRDVYGMINVAMFVTNCWATPLGR